MPRRDSAERLLLALLIDLPIRLACLAVVVLYQLLVLSVRLLVACVKTPFVLLIGFTRLLSQAARASPTVGYWGAPAYVRKPIPSEIKQQVWARDGGRCVLCGGRYDLHYDHDIPVSKGGSNTVKNIRLLCASCNLRKGAKIE